METVHFLNQSAFGEQALSLFKKQKEFLQLIMPYAEVEHIGSAAIPNSLTKGDLDIQLLVRLEDFESTLNELSNRFSMVC